ncbi:MAG TPA: GntG family PLP-dependent aldolase [Actinomycetota bacterium]|nr:GntG family PLP-dependent aldolase [Actinomycetota bacterium]
MIDLRSDTVTRPSEAMRRAMAAADVGDDWFGDDPTVNRLQDRAAATMGTEAALFVASGTMANQIALRVLVRPGHEYVTEARAHVASVEVHAAAANSGIAPRGIHAALGLLSPEQVAEAVKPDPYRVRVVDVVCVENTHQVGGGSVLAVETLRGIRKVAGEAELPLYLDGARLFNAAVASGTPVGEFAAEADALMFALSKGLGAPVGSVLCGPAAFIEEARRVRIQLGGGWRQAGVLAAAGLLALEEGPDRLPEDHANARQLADGIADVFPAAVHPEQVETNIVFVEPSEVGIPTPEIVDRLRGEGVLTGIVGGRVRMVTHLDVSSKDVDEAIAAWRTLSR